MKILLKYSIFLFIFFLLINSCYSQVQTEESSVRKNRIVKQYDNKEVIIKFRRQWIKERSFMLILNLTRTLTLHQPLIGIGTFRMNKGAYVHSLDMAKNDFCSHKGFHTRSNTYHFRGENVINHNGIRVWGERSIGLYFLKFIVSVPNFFIRSSAGLFIGWMTSDGHRKNMMSWKWFFSGIGFCKKITIEKQYNDEGKIIERNRSVGVYGTQVFK